eukprot:TRINITY_DN9632_c0_g1_i1.p1 TRINITY_DN9632_c0_g1~~TRINITY_DN9632_c0_g1_i1.p1  ORF type:complete len:708 (-),score=172.51 TRINITY_DN9632_c0_g1_i1:34-2157(-)
MTNFRRRKEKLSNWPLFNCKLFGEISIQKKQHVVKQLQTDLNQYIPVSLIKSHSATEWAKIIMEKYELLKGTSIEKAKMHYMKQIRKFPRYGSSTFKIKSNNAWLPPQEYEVTINYKGINIVDPAKKTIFESFDYWTISTCSHMPGVFEFSVSEKNSVKPRVYTFETSMGDEIDPLVRTYSVMFRKNHKAVLEVQEATDIYQQLTMPPPVDVTQFALKQYVSQNCRSNVDMNYSKDAITDAFHKGLSPSLVTLAVSIFQDILNYTGDAGSGKKKTSKEAIVDITSKAIKNPNIRNEVYLQLCKQITNNPKHHNKHKTWILMALCLGVFLPTKDLLNYIRAFLQIHSRDATSENGLYAIYGHKRLQRLINNGQRKLPPSKSEIDCVKKRGAMTIKFVASDGKSAVLPVDSSTTIKEIFIEETKKLQMVAFELPKFAIYQRPNKDGSADQSIKETALIGDVIAESESNRPISSEPDLPTLLLKRKIWSNPTIFPIDVASQTITLTQIMEDIIGNRFPLTNDKDAIGFASLFLQIHFGDFFDGREKEVKLQELISPSRISTKEDTWWTDQIVQNWRLHTGKSTSEARKAFFELASTWTHFGTSIFYATQSLSAVLPKELWLGVNTSGILIFKMGSRDQMMSFSFKQVMNWGPSADSFFFMSGDLMQPQKFVFGTKQANDISELLHIYINEIKNAPASTPGRERSRTFLAN